MVAPDKTRSDQATDGGARERILDAAFELFKTKGYVASSVEEIASCAEAAKGSVYWHFPSKEALLLALVDREIARIRERLSPLSAGGTDAAELINRVLDLDVWREKGLDDLRKIVFSAVMAMGDEQGRSRLGQALLERGYAIYKDVLGYLSAAFAKLGPPAELTPGSAAKCLLACIWGVVHMVSIQGWPPGETAEMLKSLRKLFLPAKRKDRK